MGPERRVLRTDVLARVEGEGALRVRLRGSEVRNVELRIYEPPRFFEGLLRGREFREVPDLTARICGICPVAYQTSAARAMERITGAIVDSAVGDIRRLLYLGEWIESHVLHAMFLHLPDFLGYPGAIEMARDHRATVELALELKKTGNDLMVLLGGREIHPVCLRVGGLWRAPRRRELGAFRPRLERGRELARTALAYVADLDYPDLERPYRFVASHDPQDYAVASDRVRSSVGHDLDIDEFDSVFAEEHVARSNALHATLVGHGPYLVGPLARWALNAERLSDDTRAAAREAGLERPCLNPYRSLVVRMVETLWAFDEALRIVDRYREPDRPAVEVVPREGAGAGASEAPRGLCWHRYSIGARGIVTDARIVPPTAQNLRTIEDDVSAAASRWARLDDPSLLHRCELAVRNHDPCISCATHALRLELIRE